MKKPKLKTSPSFYRIAARAFFAAAIALLIAATAWPALDLVVARLFFYPADQRFMLDYNPAFQAVHWLATNGAWILAALLFAATLIAAFLRRPFLKLPFRSWLFLSLALALGPGLVANIALKDHWGRARPAQVTEFGGTRAFSPALVPQPEAHKNGSFVAGDAAFAFFLTSFGYVFSGRNRRRAFWGGMAAGVAVSWLRISMGAHFLSDTLFAEVFMLLTIAALHAAMFGRAATRECWREWLFSAKG